MKTNWFKQNLLNLIIGLVFVALFGAALWFMYQATTEKSQVESDLQVQQEQRDTLAGARPFPSQKNIDALRTDRERLQQLYEQLYTSVSTARMERIKLARGVDFVEFLRKHQTLLRTAVDGHNVKVPASFSFGFSRYTDAFPCKSMGSTPAAKQECQRLLSQLAKQVLVVDKLTGLLLDSGVEEITEIRRVEIEPGAASTDTLAANLVEDPKALYSRMPFQFTFICGTSKPLQAFLNTLAQSDWFLVLRNLRVETETTTATRSETTTDTGTAGAARETHPRLVVSARIDLVEFGAVEPETPPPARPKRTP